jgi:hypothetical protein
VPVRVGGIEDSDSWSELAKPQPSITLESLARDVFTIVHRVIAKHPEVSSLLFECAAFCPVTPLVRAEIGLPIFDFVALTDLLVASVTVGRGAGPQE